MKETPILFSASMVRAILEGRKTQTRRILKFPPGWSIPPARLAKGYLNRWGAHDGERIPCPYGQPGDRLWVKETFAPHMTGNNFGREGFVDGYYYRSDFVQCGWRGFSEKKITWKPSIFMPRAASRITLEIVNVGIQRVQSIGEAAARNEGSPHHGGPESLKWYRWLWEEINGTGSWETNPWAWVLTFKRLT